MRTISAIALCLMLVFATTGCAASKIAVVDPARLFQESEPGKAGIEHLKQLEAAMQEQLKTAQGRSPPRPFPEDLCWLPADRQCRAAEGCAADQRLDAEDP